PGIDSSHAFERTHEDSLVHTANLLYHYVQSSLITV
ncbi:peptidase M42, partial [Bacillus sp. JR_15]